MALFTSHREKRLWIFAFVVLGAIVSTLVFGRPLLGLFANQNIQAIIFVLGMLLTGATILVHGLKSRPGKTEIAILIGFAAVYLMFFLRLGLPERSHLMEYGVLAIFIHKALIERLSHGNQVLKPAVLAFVFTFAIGTIDECVQMFLPARVFDPNDVLFNGFVSVMAIGSRLVLQWVQKRFSKK